MSRVHHRLALSVLGLIVGCALPLELPDEPAAVHRGDRTDTERTSEQLSDVEWANQFFVTQVYDARWNPDGVENDKTCPKGMSAKRALCT